MYNLPKDILDAVKAAPTTLQAALEGVTEEQARQARGGDENWSIIEVMCHMRDAEERALERMEAMRDQDDPTLEGYDQEAWARERNYAATNLQDALSSFLGLRSQYIADLSALSPQDWERGGEHAEQGHITILAHAIHMVSHDAQHTAQIVRQLGRVS